MARYGRKWRRWLTFAALKGELDRRGVTLVEVDYGLPYAREYWQRDAEISVLVNADGDYPGEIGEVLKISSNGRGGRQRRLSDEQMRALLEMGEAERNRWLAKGRESELAGVWRYACGSAWGHDEKRRAEWAGLFRWAMCRGRELGLATGRKRLGSVRSWCPRSRIGFPTSSSNWCPICRRCMTSQGPAWRRW
jgi:hypothetical protein